MTEDDQIEVSNKLAALWPKATDVQCSLILSATARLDAACVVEAMEAYRITEEGDSDWPQIHSIIRRCCEVHEQMLRAKPDLCGKPEWELILRHHHACFWHYRDRAENRFKKQWPSMSQSARITLRASIDQNIANRLAADTLYCTNELISIGIEREGAVKIAAGVAKPLESLFMFLHDCMPPEVPR
jgi:hypothetical protein